MTGGNPKGHPVAGTPLLRQETKSTGVLLSGCYHGQLSHTVKNVRVLRDLQISISSAQTVLN